MISKFEVTVWEWKEFIKANKMKMPEKPKWGWQDNYQSTELHGMKQSLIVTG